MKEGLLIIDKPAGVTSHDVVETVRRRFKMKRVGHSGTLDPVATGILVVLLGKATKLFAQFVHFDKAYEATLRLGAVTSTGDIEGKVIKEEDPSRVTEEDVRRVMATFLGARQQVPPMVSAIKHKGRRLYELARRGIQVERTARAIKIYELVITGVHLPEVDFMVRCSKGTYVRRLGEEIGEALGVGGFIVRIRRTALGPFRIEDAVPLDRIDESHIRDWRS
ncbi:MAG: tRNA pseudouridine(55) synthase TruB [Deltaproteobacteria bacterium]